MTNFEHQCGKCIKPNYKSLNSGEYQIPTDVELILGVMTMHRSKDNYPHPDTFDPDNFLAEHVAVRHPFSYIPFSGGPRSCLGMCTRQIEDGHHIHNRMVFAYGYRAGIRYANIVLKMSVVYVLKSFRVSTRLRMSDMKFRMNVTLTLLSAHLVRLHRRGDTANGAVN